jgi:hypothetical protein
MTIVVAASVAVCRQIHIWRRKEWTDLNERNLSPVKLLPVYVETRPPRGITVGAETFREM